MSGAPVVRVLSRRAVAFARARGLAAFGFSALLVLAACGEDSPVGPSVPPLDTAALVAFLNDPFVRQLPGLLEDHAAAESIRRAVSTLVGVAEHEGLESIRRSFLSAHRSVERYRAEAKADPCDPTVLDALDLVLLQAEGLLDAATRSDGTAVIKLE